MHHVINLKEFKREKKLLKTKIRIKKIYHHLVKNIPKYINRLFIKPGIQEWGTECGEGRGLGGCSLGFW